MFESHTKSRSVCVYVCVCLCTPVFLSLFNDLTQWARTELGRSFLGHLASGPMPSQPQSEQTWRQTHKRTRLYAYTNCPPSLSHSHSGSTPQGPSNVHSHMHKRAHTHKHKHAHYATRLQTLLVCVWNERRVVRKTACLKKEPCPASGTNTTQSRDSVATAFSLSIFCPSVCLSPSFSLNFQCFHFRVGLLALKHMNYFAKAR